MIGSGGDIPEDAWGLALLGVDRGVDHPDGVLHDTDQYDDADEAVEVGLVEMIGQSAPMPAEGRPTDRQRVDEAS
jgi:hypothetical protein